MSDGELHAALGLHRGRRALAAALVLAALTIAVLSAVRREPASQPVEPPAADALEAASVATPPTAPPKKVKHRPRPAIATAPARTPPVVTPVSTPTPQPIVVEEPPPPQESRAVAPEPVPTPVSSARLAEDVEDPPPPPPEEPAAIEVNQASPLPDPLEGNGELIARAIAAAKRAAVRACFEHELKEQPKLTGTVVVELDLAPPTQVNAVRVSDDLNRPTFTRCVTLAMQSVRFTALDEEISVRVPYVLSPERK